MAPSPPRLTSTSHPSSNRTLFLCRGPPPGFRPALSAAARSSSSQTRSASYTEAGTDGRSPLSTLLPLRPCRRAGWAELASGFPPTTSVTLPSFSISGNRTIVGLAHPRALEASVHSWAESLINPSSRRSPRPVLSFHQRPGRGGLLPTTPLQTPSVSPRFPAPPCSPSVTEPEKPANQSSTNTWSGARRGSPWSRGRRGLSLTQPSLPTASCPADPAF